MKRGHKSSHNKIKWILLATSITLVIIFLIGYLIFDDFKKSVGLIFLYFAIDFISPQPDIDKLILIPFIYAPIIMKLGITRNYGVAYMIGVVVSFFIGIIFLVLAILLLGREGWNKFKDGSRDALNGFIDLLKNVYFTTALIFVIIIIVLFAWYFSKHTSKHRKTKSRK
jgi:heme/copper-type cytochrome/quinol oxidase subunit 2